MNHASSLAAALVVLAAQDARAGDDVILDARMPFRFGFAYTGITRAPAMSVSWGLDVDVVHVTRRLLFQLVLDADVASRLDLPDTNPTSSFTALGGGAGLFYITDGNVGLGLESTASMTFDGKELVGGGFSTRAYIYPFYLNLHDVIEHKAGRLSAWVQSAISLWVMARVDWASDGRGGTVAFGASFDVARFYILPLIELAKKKR